MTHGACLLAVMRDLRIICGGEMILSPEMTNRLSKNPLNQKAAGISGGFRGPIRLMRGNP
jgi:hypothetical protein